MDTAVSMYSLLPIKGHLYTTATSLGPESGLSLEVQPGKQTSLGRHVITRYQRPHNNEV